MLCFNNELEILRTTPDASDGTDTVNQQARDLSRAGIPGLSEVFANHKSERPPRFYIGIFAMRNRP